MTTDFDEIPVIDIGPLYGRDGAERARVDAAIGAACRRVGFLVITGQPAAARLDRAARQRLLAFFDLPEAVKMSLARHQHNPANSRIYRGWSPVLPGERSFKEGIDIGPERTPDPDFLARERLFESNHWPPEALLPSWRDAVLAYWAAMEDLGFVILEALARHLSLPETYFDDKFRDANSTLRLLRYPLREDAAAAAGLDRTDAGRPMVAAAHTDSGCLTLLAQDEVGGLQAQNGRGDWIDVPPVAGSLVVNLGDTLARWTNDALRATRHRVVAAPVVRHSIPFFFEPRFDTIVECLPVCAGPAGPKYPPVRYGDHLLTKISGYSEFRTLFRDGVLQRPTAA